MYDLSLAIQKATSIKWYGQVPTQQFITKLKTLSGISIDRPCYKTGKCYYAFESTNKVLKDLIVMITKLH